MKPLPVGIHFDAVDLTGDSQARQAGCNILGSNVLAFGEVDSAPNDGPQAKLAFAGILVVCGLMMLNIRPLWEHISHSHGSLGG